MKKKWVVVIPCGLEVIPTIKAAKELGYSIAGVDANGEAPAMEFCDLRITSPLNDFELILYQLRINRITPECFIPIVSDKAVFPAYMLNLHFGKTEINPNVLAFYSKSVLRNLLNNAGFPNPDYTVITEKEGLEKILHHTKLIVKPDDSSGSRGISIIDNPDHLTLIEAFDIALPFSANKRVIVEEYIPGHEYMVDCFIYEAKVVALLVSRKEKIQDKVSYLIHTLNTDEFQYHDLKEYIEIVAAMLSYNAGTLHIEIKIKENKFYILDLAARGGGFGVYNYYVRKCLGFDFVKATLDVCLKRPLSQKMGIFKEGLIYFITPEKEGVIKSLKSDYEIDELEDVRINFYYSEDQAVTMDITDGNRLAGIYCFAENKADLKLLFEKVKESVKQIYQA